MGSRRLGITIVRSAALLIGAAAVVGAVVVSVGPSRDFIEFRDAQLCSGGVPTPAADAHGCVAREIATVAGSHTYQTTESDGDGGESTTTHYVVTIRHLSGTKEDQEVAASVYEVAQPGDVAALRIWRGAVVGMTVDGRSDQFIPPSESTLQIAALVAWFGLGLLLWFLLGDGTLGSLFGNYSLRPVVWFVFGISLIMTVRDVITDALTTTDYVVVTVLWIVGLPIIVLCVFKRFHAEDDGEPSVLSQIRARIRSEDAHPSTDSV